MGTNDEFIKEASKKRTGLMAEFIAFLMDNKKWWLLPILVVFLLFGTLLVFVSTGAAPFIYALF